MYTNMVYINAPINDNTERGVVKIDFDRLDLQDLCENEKLMKKKYGNACANKLKTRIADFQAATNVSELVSGKPHPLKGKRLGQLSVLLFWVP